ncbi:Glycine betaine ABC transport system, ATP-binding protein OpuAA [Methanosarcina siciliae T4/M]|uniref:Glycine betaine ABC transport system, ATP-binding protein OpuAA n=3 Tax=Methanosarcina siciliae TaxID=38027 RepID=A0A0E3LB29_9EURY|nr:Glycine betaine ABC transport system, ATP-binding protein OpuAA [Methanosarcina siciliae T4/M]AKB33051.1 Glycine betaine ABC transport system, ATP-binding protein OpuAA [Methanosarcina siciliae HI350]
MSTVLEKLRSNRGIIMDKNVKLEVRNITKVFGKDPQKVITLLNEGLSKSEIFAKTKHTVGLNNVNFEVYDGEIFVIMGLSGSGKSTLLRCLNRLIEPTAGEILIDGQAITGMSPEALRTTRRNKLGMVFQSFALLPHRTVLDNVAYGLEIQGIPKEERYSKALEAIETVGLKGYEHSRITELSGGMKQRVGLARALANDPDILLMDEAFSALDPLIRSDMQDELIALEDRVQKTIIFVSHDLDEALKLGDRIALMKDGEVVQIGTPEEILTEPADSYVSRFVAGVDRSKILTAESVMKRPEPLVSLNSGPRVAIQLMKDHGISSIYVVEGKNRRLKGILMIGDALEALKTGKSLEAAMIPEAPRVAPDLPLSDIIPLIAESPYPLAVVNDSGKLIGIIVRGTVLGALAMSGDNSGENGHPEEKVSEEKVPDEGNPAGKTPEEKPPEKTIFSGKNEGEAGPPSEDSDVPHSIINSRISSEPVPLEAEAKDGAPSESSSESSSKSDAIPGPEVKTC